MHAAQLGALAQRGPVAMPAAIPVAVAAAAPMPPFDALFLPPPVPPPQGLPPVDADDKARVAAANAAAEEDADDFSIQTIGVDNPAATPTGATIIEVTMTQPAVVETAQPTPADITPTPETETETETESEPHHGGPHRGPDDVDAEGDKKGPHHKEPTSGDCRLMGPFAIFVQLGLGGLALMSLVFKRWRERPQRPVKIWFFDVSKQVFGSVLVHMANVFMSLLTSGRFNMSFVAQDVGTAEEPYVPNPCSFYLLNLAIDTTLGIPILIFLLHVTTAAVSYTPLGRPLESIQSGNYGRPPNAWWWLKQSIIYFCGLFGMKICVLIIFLTMPWISRVGDWALSWTDGNEELQIVFVMMLFPLIMNAMQYYIIDSFIKGEHAAAADGAHHTGAYDQLADSADDEGSEGDEYMDGSTGSLPADGGEAGRAASKTAKTAKSLTVNVGDPEYDPEVDGDSPTIIGSSSSQRSRHDRAAVGSVPKEMYPAE